MFRFLIPFETTIYYELNINSHGPIPSSRFSHNLCCFIFLINVFLMTACESKAFSSLNFNTTTSAVLTEAYGSFQWFQGSASPCQVSPPAGHVLLRCSVNTIDTLGKLAHESLICFSVSTWMKLNYCYFAEIIHQHLPLLFPPPPSFT